MRTTASMSTFNVKHNPRVDKCEEAYKRYEFCSVICIQTTDKSDATSVCFYQGLPLQGKLPRLNENLHVHLVLCQHRLLPPSTAKLAGLDDHEKFLWLDKERLIKLELAAPVTRHANKVADLRLG